MFRRILGTLTVFALVIAMAGCGGGQKTPQEYYDMGVRFLSEGNCEEAVLAFTALLEIEPNHVQALTGRGQALQQMGGEENLTSAEADYRAALAIDDSDEQIWLALADLLMETGSESDAKDLLAQTYEKFGTSEELSTQLTRLQNSGALEGEDLTRFGLVPHRTDDFQPVQLSDAEVTEITELLYTSYSQPIEVYQPGYVDYDCTAPEAENRALAFIMEPYNNSFNRYFSWDDIRRPYMEATDGNLIPADPLGQIPDSDGYNVYDIVPGTQTDWMLRNVYNVEPSHPASAVSLDTADFGPMLAYYYNGEYYCQQPYGIGDYMAADEHTLHDFTQGGDFLYLRLHIEPDYEFWQNAMYNPAPLDKWALLKKNTSDDRTVWSLCYLGGQPLEDISRFQT